MHKGAFGSRNPVHDRHHEEDMRAHALPDRLCRVASVGGEAGDASAAIAMPHVWPVGDVEEEAMTDIEARLRAVPMLKCQYCGPQDACPHHRNPDYPALAAVVREMVEEPRSAPMSACPNCQDIWPARLAEANGLADDYRRQHMMVTSERDEARATLAEQVLEIERLRGQGHAVHARAVAAENDWRQAETELERLHGEVELLEGEVGSMGAWVTQLMTALSAYHRADYHDGPCYEWEGECHPAQSSPATFPQHSIRCRTTRAALRVTPEAGEKAE